MEQNFKIKVNDSFYNNFKSSDINELDVIKLSKSKFHVINNHKSFDIKIEKSDFLKKEYIIQVNSNNYTIKISNQLDILIKEMGLSIGSAKKINDIKAPMPGLILSVNVKEKQKIKEGETLLILEAMKMENAIASPKDGVIKTIHIKSGGTVEKGELMIEFE
ncbi:acetyl-CoA carboxylase biotin carboxyl carrier protein subunit [Lutibacter sp.]|uniref:acetyl-CoA carboxylase biotin carboxyl carrier protein subunit n=1 Tax=Lutibacter sp. TaxID=1925666 RepID=UPI003563AD52